MVNYKIQQVENVYEIIETQTGNIIAGNLDQHQAKTACRHLNFGGGFDGHTPEFFLQNTKISYSKEGFFA
jgi:hypothetical protein